MPKQFDATLKDMGQDSPHAVLTAFDRPPTLPVSLLNVDLSTVTTAADLVIGLGDPLEEIIHLDFQASAAAYKHLDILAYQALLVRLYWVPVHSIVVLLRPEAAHANMDGTIRYAPRPGRGKMDFSYEVIRLWERPAEELLAGDVGTVPLALLGKLPVGVSLEEAMSDIIQRLIQKLVQEAPAEQVPKLLTSAFVLSGLRLEPDVARRLFQGANAMRESTTYMSILEEGREAEARRILLRLGEKRLGPADEATRAQIAALQDIDRLEVLLERLDQASKWSELLQLP